MSKKRRKLYQRGRGSELGTKDLKVLTSLTKKALRSPYILQAIKILKTQILESKEPFIWKVLSEQLLGETFPNSIRSGWILVLKPNTTTPCHYHPNSAQYTTVIEGGGKIRIGEKQRKVQTFDLLGNQQVWYVIPKNVPHAVTTREHPMVVFSFHTCPPNRLLEVEVSSGRLRYYEKYQRGG